MADPQSTGGPEGLFRPEALEHRARQRGGGDVIRVAPRWTSAAFYLLLGLFVVALAAGLTIEIDRFVQGPTATDDEGRLVILLPSALAPDVGVGRPVDVGEVDAEVVTTDDTVLYPPDVQEIYDLEVSGPSIAVVTSAAGGETGSARVLIEREPAIVALIPGLKALFGNDDA